MSHRLVHELELFTAALFVNAQNTRNPVWVVGRPGSWMDALTRLAHRKHWLIGAVVASLLCGLHPTQLHPCAGGETEAEREQGAGRAQPVGVSKPNQQPGLSPPHPPRLRTFPGPKFPSWLDWGDVNGANREQIPSLNHQLLSSPLKQLGAQPSPLAGLG